MDRIPKNKPCPECPKILRGNGGLMRHLKTVHDHKITGPKIERAARHDQTMFEQSK